MPANPTLECFSTVQRRKRSHVKMIAAEFLRASITLTIAFLRPAQERSEKNWMWGSHYLQLLYLFPSHDSISVAYEE